MLPKNTNPLTIAYKKKFTYRVRILVPENTAKTTLYPYEQVLLSFTDKLVKQLKTSGHKKYAGGGGSRDGYDDIKGRYIEQSIEVNIAKSTTELDEKIIWVE